MAYPRPKFIAIPGLIPIHSGTTAASGEAANKLVTLANSVHGNFNTGGIVQIVPGMVVHNTTDGTSATITAIDSSTTLSLSADIMENSEAFTIYAKPLPVPQQPVRYNYWSGASFIDVDSPDLYSSIQSGTSTTPTGVDPNFTLDVGTNKDFDDLVLPGDLTLELDATPVVRTVTSVNSSQILGVADSNFPTSKNFRVLRKVLKAPMYWFNCENIDTLAKTDNSTFDLTLPTQTLDTYTLSVLPTASSEATMQAELQAVINKANAQTDNNNVYVCTPQEVPSFLLTGTSFA
jgi:hypothetical protein